MGREKDVRGKGNCKMRRRQGEGSVVPVMMNV
jgi:hypothetical protein